MQQRISKINLWKILIGISIGLFLGIVALHYFLERLGQDLESARALKASLRQELLVREEEQQENCLMTVKTARLPEAIGFVEQSFSSCALDVHEILITQLPAPGQSPYIATGLSVRVVGEQAKILEALIKIEENSTYAFFVQEVDITENKGDVKLQLLVERI